VRDLELSFPHDASLPVLLSGLRLFDVLLEPGEKTLEQILLIAMSSDAVVRVRVHHQRHLATEMLHRLVHLLGVDDRLIPVFFSADEERRRGDIFDVHER